MGMQEVEIEIDANIVADWVVGSTSINTTHSVLISDCGYLMEQLPRVEIRHCLREANQCADFLAKQGAAQEQNFRIYDDPPVNVSILLCYDSIGMSFERLCLNSNF